VKAAGKVYVARFRAPPGKPGIRAVRGFLKTALRHFNLRCLAIGEEFLPELIIEHSETEDDETLGPTLPFDDDRFYARVGPRPGRKSRWRSIRCGTHHPHQMEERMTPEDLEKLKTYAASTKSQFAFGGATYIQFDYRNGQLLAGKNRVDVLGREFGADMLDVMGGFRQFVDKRPIYALTRILDPIIVPIERAELGDTDKSRWLEDKDPWTGVTVLPLFDPGTHEIFSYAAAFGERGAASSLIGAYADHVAGAANPEAAEQLPLITFSVRKYPRNDGKGDAFALQIDIGGWIARPKALPRIEPPPLMITREPKAAGNGAAVAADSPTAKSSDGKIKLERKIVVPSAKPDFDDSVPF